MNGELIVKKSKLYTVGFTIASSCICAVVLTFANAHCQIRITANENFDKIRAIVETLGLWKGGLERNKIIDTYFQNVTSTKSKDMIVYQGHRDDKLLGYAVEMLGRGSYGRIKGILAISPDRKQILAMQIYQQNETPGLGARIASPKWLSQFSNIPLVTKKGMPGVIISSMHKGPNIIHGITSATRTVHSLNKIINKTIEQFLATETDLEELNLKK